ncbi:MAG: crossover junction endodeoxyribonuclease RuvC [Melioribacteraceae bacterium]|jgi:crossover junction endodeoxyribonuclease RuvC|nr:crossover junction endodeoxyribonuclease RuvC [Melioribacteraceae bacterium]RJP58687.1 MAG: crossover junction endodeoxyribonuclease RuvC [Ignavibacteriales bacterium]WKZ69600.1 MAG: crossover junction endodeoxyribonuclease RuvC [Melioribacteraceae bacterium]
MTIIGIDPGTIFTGFGVIKYHRNQLSLIDSGIIKTPAVKEMAPRLEAIYNELSLLIRKYDPDAFALETAFYGKNVQSALKIGYARGVSMLAAKHNNLDTAEYSPREVKKSVVGNGAASKEQVQYMIKKLLSIRKTKIKFDETDALAVAICHAFKLSSPLKTSGSWKKFIEANPDKIISK